MAGAQQHIGRRDRAAVLVRLRDDRRLHHRGMPANRVLDLARRDPHARALEEIVAAPLEPEEPFPAPPIDIAGAYPAIADRLGGLFRLAEVVRDRRAAARVKLAATDALDDVALLVGQLALVA